MLIKNKPNLLKLQKNFFSHLYNKNQKEILKNINYSSFEALERLNIYRNNVFGNFLSILSSIYEVTKKELGTKKFNEFADLYSKKYFSKSGSLNNYGDFFCNFLKTKKLDKKYLYNLAMLELAYYKAYFATDYKNEFPLEKFKKINANNFQNLTLKIHPSCLLFSSNFAIYSIFKRKRNAKNGEFVLVYNALGEANITKLSLEEFMFLSLANKGFKLYDIYKKICKKINKEFDIGLLLNKFIANRIIVDFKIKK